jgi:hypothetical protein
VQNEGICPWSNMANVDFYDVTIIYQSMARNGGFQPSDLGKQDFWDKSAWKIIPS